MRLVMMGTGQFAEPTFKALLAGGREVAGLVTNPDRPSGKERDMLRGMKKIALEHGVPVFQPESVNTPEGVAAVRAFRPDLLVVAAYGQILSADVLNTAPQGGVNVHASLLPKYRGAAPIAWAIYHGEKQTGVTIIRMSTRMDAGDMLAQEALEIGAEETAGELEERLAELGAKLALSVIEQIERGAARGVKQDLRLVTKAPKLKKEHGLIDWSRTAEQVCNQIRAMQPWPSAYAYWRRQGQPPMRLLVLKAMAYNEPPAVAAGGVSRLAPVSLAIAAGVGVVELRSVQPAGKRRMAIDEFLRGHQVQVGDCFGGETA